jgi:RHS repeat-associated protein
MSADGTRPSEQVYQFSHPSSDSTLTGHTQTTVLDPVGNQKVWNFIQGSSAGWDTGLSNQMLTYQGTSTVLRQVNTTWTQDTFSSTTITNPRACATTTFVQGTSGGWVQSTVEKDTDAYGNTLAVREYGFGAGSANSSPPSSSTCSGPGDGNPVGAIYRTTTTTYLTGSAYTALNIFNRPASVTVCAGSAGCSSPASVTTTTYDNQTIQNASLPQHDSSRVPAFTTRGNPGQVTNNGVVTTMQYDLGGNVLSTTGGLHGAATASYLNTGQLQNASSGANYVGVTYNPSTTVNSVTGSSSDTTTFGYTDAYRPLTTTAPDGSVTNYTYSDGGVGSSWTYPFVTTVTSPAGKVTQTILDGFGRTTYSMTQLTSSPAVWITTATTYNACSCSATGKAVSASRPYQSDVTGAFINGDNPSFTTTTTTFDGLGRPKYTTLPAPSSGTLATGASNSNLTSYYYDVENDTVNGTAWLGTRTTVTDPAGLLKRYLYDAFGELLRVDELNSSNALAETAAYSYDVLGHLIQVQMPKANGSYTQTRTFVYNTLGQLTSSTTPEKGTVTYTYITSTYPYNGGFSSAAGLLWTKTEGTGAKGANQTKTLYYYYDSMRRLIAIQSSPSGPVVAGYTYDREYNSNIASLSTFGPNTYGRLITASANGYTYHYSYNSMGHVVQQVLETPFPASYNSAMAIIATYTYDSDGKLTSMNYPGQMYMTADEADLGSNSMTGLGANYTFAYDGLGRQTSVSTGGNTVASGTYNDAGKLTSWTEGSSTLTRTYDPARGWLTNLTAASDLNMTYAYNADGQALSVTDAVNSGQSATYTYDNLNRLATASTPNWGMSWAYDEFGNRTSQTGTGTASSVSQSLTYDPSSNQITNSGYIYDAAGNMTAMPSGSTITYDALDRVQTVTSGSNVSTMVYDAFGRRAEHDSPSGNNWVYFYDPSGRLLATYPFQATYESSCQGTNYCYNGPVPVNKIYLAGQMIGQWSDRTGSVRYTASGSAYSHYYPYGEEITSNASEDTFKYAQLYRDSDTMLDYAMHRFYASELGRFLTVDPKRKSARPPTPQSWNRYAYVMGDPANAGDPTGLDCCADGGDSPGSSEQLLPGDEGSGMEANDDEDDEGGDQGGQAPPTTGPGSESAPFTIPVTVTAWTPPPSTWDCSDPGMEMVGFCTTPQPPCPPGTVTNGGTTGALACSLIDGSIINLKPGESVTPGPAPPDTRPGWQKQWERIRSNIIRFTKDPIKTIRQGWGSGAAPPGTIIISPPIRKPMVNP